MIVLKVFFAALIGITVAASSASAQIPSPLKNISISATVAMDSSGGIYKYNYKIVNPSNNDGQIFYIGIDISKPPQSQELSSKGLVIQVSTNPRGIMLKRSFDEEITRMGSLLQKPVIPMGTQIPSGWSSGVDVMGNVMWGGNEKNLIKPGQFLEGLMVLSFGLPGIRDVFVEPDIDYDNLPDEYWENVELTKQLQDSLVYTTKTLGPTAPPADFKPIEFLDYIISLKHEAFSLGWIVQGKDDDKGKKGDEEKGIIKSLDKKLENAKEKLKKGDIKEAIEKLKSFIHEIEALYKEDKNDKDDDKKEKAKKGKKEKEDQRDGHITSEAYALLKYNAKYLIEQLGGGIKEDMNRKKN